MSRDAEFKRKLEEPLQAPSKAPHEAPPTRELIEWFESRKRELPWRSEPTPYRVWISEIMLQQTQVATVRPYFERWMESFPTVEKLAHAPLDQVLALWAGLGYYSRARNVHLAARQIVENGRFPGDREEWEALSGVGPYTAGAILSIAYGKPEAILDGNVERVLSRFTLLSSKPELWREAARWVEAAHAKGESPSALNQGLMELGALACTPKKPQCVLCPLRSGCRAFAGGAVDRYPVKKKRAPSVEVRERCAWIWDADRKRVFLSKSEGWRKGLWDMPVLKAAPGALVASGFKKLGSCEIKAVVTHHKITRVTEVFAASAKAAKTLGEGEWIAVSDLIGKKVAFGAPFRKTLERVISGSLG